jgi:hypothetical protein
MLRNSYARERRPDADACVQLIIVIVEVTQLRFMWMRMRLQFMLTHMLETSFYYVGDGWILPFPNPMYHAHDISKSILVYIHKRNFTKLTSKLCFDSIYWDHYILNNTVINMHPSKLVSYTHQPYTEEARC